MMRPERKSQLRPGPKVFSQAYVTPCSNTREPHFEQAPSASCLLKSGGGSSSALLWPKSNSGRSSSFSRTTAANGLPCRLRKPVNGPTERFLISSAISSADHSRPETTFQMEKSHFWHWNLR